MAPRSRNREVDGRAQRRTIPGRPYQVPVCTAPPVTWMKCGPLQTRFRPQGRHENRTYHSAVPLTSLRSIRLLVVVLVGIVAAAACAPSTFDPASACTEDGRFAGAYPALEEKLPREYIDRAADSIDSGRNCEAASLGTLGTRGVEELRYAGAIWDKGSGAAVSYAILEAEGLETDWVAEFYEAGARAGRRVEEVTVSDIALGELEGRRIDALNGESFQTVVVGPRDDDQVPVVIVANPIRQIETREAHENVVLGALSVEFEGVCSN